MERKSKIRIVLNFLAAIFLIALTAEYDNSRLAMIETLERENYDQRLRGAEAARRDDIVIVDIDRDTLRKFGNWPISRDLFARLNQQLFGRYRARIAAYALPFSQPDDGAIQLLDAIGAELRQSDGDFAALRAIGRLHAQYDYDRHMVNTLQRNRVALGHVFDNTGRVEGDLPPPIDAFFTPENQKIAPNALRDLTADWPAFSGYSGNLPAYLRAADNAAGHLNFTVDSDGIVRRAPYFIHHAGGLYPSLPLAIYMRLQNLSAADGIITPANGGSISRMQIGQRWAAVSRGGDMYMRYLGAGGRNVSFSTTPDAVFRYVSFADVVEGKVPNEQLDDKIVIVGASSDQLRLLYPTPVNPALPGAEIVGTQLANLLEENMLHRGDHVATYETLLALALAILLSALFALASPLVAGLGLAAAVAGYAQFVSYQWNTNHEIWALLPACLMMIGLFIVNTIIGFIIEWRSNRHLQSAFGQYVPPEFAKKIGAQGGDKSINLEGEMRELSVLFSDVRDFTAISEKLTPRELTLLMNRMLTVLTEAVHAHGGTVDKYIGDAVMAFWNAPLADPQHAKNSVLAALDMQSALQKLGEQLASQGFTHELRLGIGICTGDANVGNMGSTRRMAYTAIGDTVNMASRVESLTKHYHCPILITESTQAQCRDEIACRPVDLVRVKGRQQPAILYQPLGATHRMPPEDLAAIAEFERFLELYVSGNFAAAQTALAAYRQNHPKDDELLAVYEDRLQQLISHPPSEWDGIFTHKKK